MDQQYFQSEIHKLLKLGPDLSKPYEEPVTPLEHENAGNPGAPFNLPISHATAASADDIIPTFKPVNDQARFETIPLALNLPKPTPAPQKKTGTNWSSIIVYPLVFIAAFGFFYVLLNFGAIMSQIQGWFAKSEEEVVLQEDLTAYNEWIQGYFFAIGSKDKLGPNDDLDVDGLSNLDEFIIKTNPTLADSDSDGVSDGIELINGTNPWGTGQLTSKQKKLVEKLDLIKINNRISFNAASGNLGAVLGQHTQNFDLNKPGRLSIPKLSLQVPLIWTQEPSEFDSDLQKGVVHYPGTAMPGELGTVYVSGHSSDYFWKKHPYKQVFAKINALEAGDEIFVDVYGLDGKIYNYKYVVASKNIYAPDDQKQFFDNSAAKLNLSTCWPIGTQKDRYVVSAVLEK